VAGDLQLVLIWPVGSHHHLQLIVLKIKFFVLISLLMFSIGI